MAILTNEIPTETATPSVSIDVEIFGMRKRKLHRPEGTFACLVISDGVDIWLIDREDLIQEALDAVNDCRWIMHNSQFDLFHLRRWAVVPDRPSNMLWDTMIIERLLFSGYYDGFSLNDLARRYLDIQMDKTIRKEFEKATQLNSRLRKYTTDDGMVTYKVYAHQHVTWINSGQSEALGRLWELECETIFTILDFKGFKVDEVGWTVVADAYEETRDNIRASLDFNPASPKQVMAALAKRGIHVKNTQAKTLEEYKDRPMIQSILKYRKAMKLAGTYGRKFIEENMEEDGRVYASYRTLGAATGRMSSANPNMQNIPRAKEFRAGFIAHHGHKLVVADYSQQEPRIAGFLSQDANLLGMFLDGKDIHLEVTRWIFDDPTIPRFDPRRYIGKTLNLAITYGLTAHSLAERVTTWYRKHGYSDTMNEKEAERVISKFFLLFNGLSEWIDHARHNGGRDEYVETKLGRRVWLNIYNRQWPNIASNAPIQGGAADQMKIALNMFRKVCKRLGWAFPVVSVVHDEIVAEAPDDLAEEMRDVLVQCMIAAGEELYPDIPWKVDAVIGDSWATKE